MLVSKLTNGTFEIKLYRKPTHTNRYLDFNSNHPLCQKLSVAQSLFHRAEELSSNKNDKCKEFNFIRKVLHSNNYPPHVLQRARSVRNVAKKSAQNPKGYASIPYIKNYSERIARILRNYNIKTYYKPFNKIQDILGLPKDPIEPSRSCGVVYEVGCSDCNKVYIGQTRNSLDMRLAQHKAAVRGMQCDKSALAQHAVSESHTIDWKGAKVITKSSQWRQRMIEEAFYTHAKRERAINRCDEFLPDVYKALT